MYNKGVEVESSAMDTTYFRKVGMLLFIPILWAVSPAVGYGIGYVLDRIFNTGDVCSVVFVFLGIGAAARETYLITQRVARDGT